MNCLDKAKKLRMLPDGGTSIGVHEGIDGHFQEDIEGHVKRRRRSVEEKQRIAKKTLEAGALDTLIAPRHRINANQVLFPGARSAVNGDWARALSSFR
jgi:hypothetical protein